MKSSQLLSPSSGLHLEGGAVLVSALLLYGFSGGNWWLFVLLALAPDLSWLGYLAGARVGAFIYNVFHLYVFPLLLLLIGYLLKNPLLAHLALIWIAHIGADRLFGYGLKYATEFKDTHFQHI